MCLCVYDVSTSYCLVTLKDLWNANVYVCMRRVRATTAAAEK